MWVVRFCVTLLALTFMTDALGKAQTIGSKSQDWQLVEEGSGEDKVVSLASFPAKDPAGRTIGYFEASAYCSALFASITGTLKPVSPNIELFHADSDSIRNHPWTKLEVTVGNGAPASLVSQETKPGVLEVEFTTPAWKTDTTGATGILGFHRMQTGEKFAGNIEALKSANTLRIAAPLRGDKGPVIWTIDLRTPGFKHFETRCDEVQPDHPPDIKGRLAEQTEDAAKTLPADDAQKLRDYVATFEQALRSHDKASMNDAVTHVNDLNFFGAEKRCEKADQSSCAASSAIDAVHKSMQRLVQEVYNPSPARR